MKLRSYILLTCGVAGAIFAASLAAISILVAQESQAIANLARNKSIHHDLASLSLLLVKDIPPDAAQHVELSARNIANVSATAAIDGDYVLTGRLREAAEAVDAWREVIAAQRPAPVRQRIVLQVRLHVLEAMTAATDLLRRSELRLIDINQNLRLVAVVSLVLMLGLVVAVSWLLHRQVTRPLRGFMENLNAFTDEGGTVLPIRTPIREFRELHDAFEATSDRLKVAFREVAEREGKYSALFYNSVNGAILVDLDGRIQAINPRACEILECMEGEARGSEVGRFLDTQPPDPTRFLTARIAPGQVIDTVMRRSDGTSLAVELGCNTFSDPSGAEITALLFRDISDRKKAEAERKELEAQLMQAQKIETVGTLAGGIAHDLNNILMPIVGYADLLLRRHARDGDITEYIEKITMAAAQATELVKKIMTFSRPTHESFEPFALAPVVHDALELVRAGAPPDIAIVADLDDRCPAVNGDAAQIKQVLINLCINACQAMEAGGVGELRVSAKPVHVDAGSPDNPLALARGDYVRISVADTGPGIDRNVQERIFDPFFTTKERDKGTGLGLSVVHGIVTAHGGEIRVSSEYGKGATFDIYIPADDRPPAIVSTVEPAIGGLERILLVDDEEANTTIISKMLGSLGYSVTCFNDSRAALDAFAASSDGFDLVITDQLMPDMTGEVLAGKILELREGLPIILITGYSTAVTAENAASMGIRQLLIKPLTVRRLDDAIRAALDGTPSNYCAAGRDDRQATTIN